MLDGVAHSIDALGFRSRTWGFRDDSMQFVEHSSLFACFPDGDITAMKFRWPDGSLRAAGAVLTDAGAEPIVDYHITRDRVGLLLRGVVDCADGRQIEISRSDTVASFWCPIGPLECNGPIYSQYEEFIEVETDDGRRGMGLAEHAVARLVY